MMCQDSNRGFKYNTEFKFNWNIHIKIITCKIVKLSKFMLHNITRLTKVQTFELYIYYYLPVTQAIHEKAQWNTPFIYSCIIIIII